jgi:hypothetical protein
VTAHITPTLERTRSIATRVARARIVRTPCHRQGGRFSLPQTMADRGPRRDSALKPRSPIGDRHQGGVSSAAHPDAGARLEPHRTRHPERIGRRSRCGLTGISRAESKGRFAATALLRLSWSSPSSASAQAAGSACARRGCAPGVHLSNTVRGKRPAHRAVCLLHSFVSLSGGYRSHEAPKSSRSASRNDADRQLSQLEATTTSLRSASKPVSRRFNPTACPQLGRQLLAVRRHESVTKTGVTDPERPVYIGLHAHSPLELARRWHVNGRFVRVVGAATRT